MGTPPASRRNQVNPPGCRFWKGARRQVRSGRTPLREGEMVKGRTKRILRSEAGFGLVEAVAALMILSVVLISLSMSLMGSYRSLRTTRYREQAIGLASQTLESARSLTYAELVMNQSASTLASDTRFSSCTPTGGAAYAMDPDGSGTKLGCENLVSAPGGDFDQHKRTKTLDGKAYTVYSYVTWHTVPGTTGKAKLVTVIVQWDAVSRTESHRVSTLVSQVDSALPAPNFAFTPVSQTIDAPRGTQVVIPHRIKNLGVNDRYDVTFSGGLPSWVVSYYKDVDSNGIYNPGTDTLMTDTDGSGKRDTGTLALNATYDLLVVFDVGAADAIGNVAASTTITSAVNPQVTSTASDTVSVSLPVIKFYLHNFPTPPTGDTTAVKNLAMDANAPTAATLFKYSTNWSASWTGRYVKKGGSDGESSTEKMVNWVYQQPTTRTYSGDGTVRVWVANTVAGKCANQIKVKAALRIKSSATTDSHIHRIDDVEVSLTPPAGSACGVFHQIDITFPAISRTVNANEWIELKLRGNGEDFSTFAYDTTTYPSVMTLRYQ